MVLALAGDLGERPALYLSIHAILFAFYLAAVRTVRSTRAGAALVIVSALAFRLILLPAQPSLSDDIYRYLWEGRLQLNNINPYAYIPSDPELAEHRDWIYEGMNYKDLPAIYPPLMQWVFAAGAAIGPSTIAMKIPFVAADIVLALLLIRLARSRGQPAANCLLYAWNPLVVVEVAGSGHNDSLGVCLLVASTVGIIGERRVLSMAALGASALSKLYPLALLPLFARRVRPVHLLIPPALVAACYLPYLGAGENLVRSAREYAERWRFNDSAFTVLVAGADAAGISPLAKRWADAAGVDSLYAQPHMLARGAAMLFAVVAMALILRAQRRPGIPLEEAIYLFTGVVLVLQPTLHPWYLIWILPWMAVRPSPAWIALSGLIAFSYVDAPWVRWVEFVPFYGLLAFGAWRRRRRGRTQEVVC